MITQKQSIITPVLFAVAMLLCTISSAQALDGALMTGQSLANLCASKKNDDQFACQSYIAGVIDYHRLIRGLGTVPSVDFCLPRDLKMAQIKQVVYAYIVRHTEHRDFIAAPAVAMSLYNRFPCPKRRR